MQAGARVRARCGVFRHDLAAHNVAGGTIGMRGVCLRGCYHNGSYAFRARVIATDVLIVSSHDRGYVERVVERHAQSALSEAS